MQAYTKPRDTISNPTPLGLPGHQQIGQASTVEGTTTAYQQQNNPSQSCEEAKKTRDNLKQNAEHITSPQGNTELFLALLWPEQLGCNTQTRVYQQPNFPLKMVEII